MCACALAEPTPPLARGVPLSWAQRRCPGAWRQQAPPPPLKFTFSMGPGWVRVCETDTEQFAKGHTSAWRSDPRRHQCEPDRFVLLNNKQVELKKSRRCRLWGKACVCARVWSAHAITTALTKAFERPSLHAKTAGLGLKEKGRK